jgi:hypothetical protein
MIKSGLFIFYSIYTFLSRLKIFPIFAKITYIKAKRAVAPASAKASADRQLGKRRMIRTATNCGN